MPYVKSISVHSTPQKTIKYVLNPDKTEDLLYASGINCSATDKLVYEEMKLVFEQYSDHSFDERKAINEKTPVKLFHFIHSFRPTDDVTPEQAHEMAQEWAKKSFGSDRQILVATHVDKGHIHSHVLINPYDFNGIKFNSNKKTLDAIRATANAIAERYDITPTKSKEGKRGVSYKEWSERQKGSSWKQNIKDTIDRLVYEVGSLDELYNKLTEKGYIVRRGKHTTISVPTEEDERKKSVRIDNVKSFGEGYSDDELEERIARAIQQKQEAEKAEKSTDKEKITNPFELLYVKRIREVGRLVMNGEKVQKKYSKKLPYSIENDYEIYHLAKQLQIIKRDGIVSISQLEKMMKDVHTEYESTRQEINRMNEKQRQFQLVIEQAETYIRLKNVPESQLSQADRLQLKIAQNTVSRTGVNSQADIEKIRKVFDENQQGIDALNASFESLERRYSEYADISEKYKEITRSDYITKMIEEKKRQKKTDLQ